MKVTTKFREVFQPFSIEIATKEEAIFLAALLGATYSKIGIEYKVDTAEMYGIINKELTRQDIEHYKFGRAFLSITLDPK